MRKELAGTAERIEALRREIAAALVAAVVVAGAMAGAGPSRAEGEAVPAETETRLKVEELFRLLEDPEVRAWLEESRRAAAPPAAEQPAMSVMGNPGGYLADRVAAIRQHIDGLLAAIPEMPREVAQAGTVLGHAFREGGLLRGALLVAGLVALGVGAERLFSRGVARLRDPAAQSHATVRQRLGAIALRLGLAVAALAAFAIGGIGALLAFRWPPMLREIVLGYLVAFLLLRSAMIALRAVTAPEDERLRILPMSNEAARFWYRRAVLLVGWFAFGWVTATLLRTLGMPAEARQIIAYALGLGLLAIGLESVWRRPPPEAAAESYARRLSRGLGSGLLSIYFAVLWLLWVAGAIPLFWLTVVAAALPAALRAARRSVAHLLRPAGAAGPAEDVPVFQIVSMERGIRAALIIGAALLLAHIWRIDLTAMAMSDSFATRLLRGAVSAVIVILAADFAWHTLKALIDRRIGAAQGPAAPGGEQSRRAARLRTLLPILRNMLFVVLIVMAALMVLSSMGVEIGPLVAGAGVVGVAVGFGAQTLVKDIISGVFYLLDDAFRVGEYIQSGNYKGTVESFSLRSVKLRHHRGPLYTVPFGELGAVQNMSRDWVIDIFTMDVAYDTDLDKVRKLIKRIGEDLARDPEMGANMLEPLKMQGVEQFGEFAIKIRVKMMTKPGEQFVIRRKALAQIKKAFAENGIRFAVPTVQVAGGGEAAPAVARQGLKLVQPSPEDAGP